MDIFRAHHADILDPGERPRVITLLREHGLVTFTGITDRGVLASAARSLMNVRSHHRSGPDSVSIITDTHATGVGYAAYTDAELLPHTDGTSLPDPPGLLLLACRQPADQGGDTLLADASRITATIAGQHPEALRALSAPRAARFGVADGYFCPVYEPAGPGRMRIRIRLDEGAVFSADAMPFIPLLRSGIAQHLHRIRLGAGQGYLIANGRWLHGRDRFNGVRAMLRLLGDPLPSVGLEPGFSVPALGPQTPHVA